MCVQSTFLFPSDIYFSWAHSFAYVCVCVCHAYIHFHRSTVSFLAIKYIARAHTNGAPITWPTKIVKIGRHTAVVRRCTHGDIRIMFIHVRYEHTLKSETVGPYDVDNGAWKNQQWVRKCVLLLLEYGSDGIQYATFDLNSNGPVCLCIKVRLTVKKLPFLVWLMVGLLRFDSISPEAEPSEALFVGVALIFPSSSTAAQLILLQFLICYHVHRRRRDKDKRGSTYILIKIRNSMRKAKAVSSRWHLSHCSGQAIIVKMVDGECTCDGEEMYGVFSQFWWDLITLCQLDARHTNAFQ